MKYLYRLPLGAICIVALIGLNIFHLLIHGTPLDGGTMDVMFTHANMFLTANVNTDAGIFFWRK